MWIERLDLRRIGPFKDRSIALPGPGVVAVVYGPNEAGKSTALRAIERLLYGFEAREGGLAHGFAQRLLQVGGRLRGRAGAPIDVIRRKGQGETLADPEGETIAEAQLTALLGGIGRAQFEALFGLDQPRLRAEGQALLDAGGAFGRSLLSAGAGLGAARDLRAQFAAQADALVSLRPSKKPFSQALERRNAATSALRAASLGREAWRAAEETAEAAEAALTAAQERLRAAQIQQEQAARAAASAPVVARLDALLTDSAHFGRPPAAQGAGDGDGRPAAAALREARQRWEAARDARAAAEDRLAAATRALDSAPPPSPAWDRAEAIDALAPRLESVRAARAEGDARARRREAGQAQLATAARRCGVAPERLAAETDARAPSEAEAAAIEAMLEEGRSVAAALAAAERSCAELAAADAGRAAPTPQTLERLRTIWPVAQPAAERRETAEAERAAAEDAARAADAALAAVAGPDASAGALAAQRIPDADEIAVFERRLADWEAAAATRRSRADDLTARRDRAAAALAPDADAAALEALAPAKLAGARAERDAVWREIRAAPSVHSPFELHQARVAAADDLADRRYEAAARLERREAAEAELARLQAEETALAAAAEAAQTERRALLDAWAALWADAAPALGGAPKPPAAMRRWLDARGAALERAEAARGAQARAARAEAAADEAEAALGEIADGLNFARKARPAGEKVSAAALRGAASRLEVALETARRRQAAEAALADAAQREAAWRAGYAPAAQRLGAPAEGPIDAGAAALSAWVAAPAVLAQAALIDAEADRAQAAETALAHAVAALGAPPAEDGGARAPDAPAGGALSDPAAAAAAWLEALAQDRRRAEARAARSEAVQAARGDVAAARDGEARLAARLGERLTAAGAPVPPDPAAAAAAAAALSAQLEAWGALQTEIRAARAELLAAGRGAEEAALRADIAAFAADGLTGAALEAEAAAREAARRAAEDALSDAAGDARAAAEALERLRVRSDATAQAQARADATAEMRLIAEEWGALSAAVALLDAAAERYRAQVGDPLLDRAAAQFERLTCGGFTGLSVTGGETERLQARRADAGADPVAVDEMSEGTRDQLFLALRLAAIELRAGAGETPPFIGDDIFASFDDDRAAAGLEALAGLAETTQTLLFTHHARLAEIAQSRLGPRAAVISLAGADDAGQALRRAV